MPKTYKISKENAAEIEEIRKTIMNKKVDRRLHADKKHKIEITVRQTTKAEEYATLQGQALFSYGAEFLMWNYVPIYLSLGVSLFYDGIDIIGDDGITIASTVFDQLVQSVIYYDYNLIEKMKFTQ